MIRDGYYKLSEQDGHKILRLMGQLKDAIAELLAHRYNIIPPEEIDEHPLAELTFYEYASEILKKGAN
jgi:hypothetical protein